MIAAVIADRFLVVEGRPYMEKPLPESDWQTLKGDIAARLREVRVALYGENGGPMLAKALAIPFRTLHNYESGCTIPAHSILPSLSSPAFIRTGF